MQIYLTFPEKEAALAVLAFTAGLLLTLILVPVYASLIVITFLACVYSPDLLTCTVPAIVGALISRCCNNSKK